MPSCPAPSCININTVNASLPAAGVQVYLPMSYIYGRRGTCKETPLTAAIREELYVQDYSTIDWNAARNQCSEPDLYYPHPKVSSPTAMHCVPAKQAKKYCQKSMHGSRQIAMHFVPSSQARKCCQKSMRGARLVSATPKGEQVNSSALSCRQQKQWDILLIGS